VASGPPPEGAPVPVDKEEYRHAEGSPRVRDTTIPSRLRCCPIQQSLSFEAVTATRSTRSRRPGQTTGQLSVLDRTATWPSDADPPGSGQSGPQTAVSTQQHPVDSMTTHAVAEPEIRWRLLACRVIGDVGALLLGLTATQLVQDTLLPGGEAIQPPRPVIIFNSLAILIWLVLFTNAGLYDSRRLVNASEELKLVLQAVAIGSVATAFAVFVLNVPTQRSWVLATWAGCTQTVVATRLTYRAILRSLRHSGVIVSRMLIIGAGREGRDLCRSIMRSRRLGFQVVGFLDDAQPPGPVAVGLPELLGPTSMIREAIRTHNINSILVAGGSVATETTERVYRDVQDIPIDLHLSTGILGVAASRVAVQRFADTPVLGLRRVQLTRWQRIMKRAFDLLVAGLLVTTLSPVLLLCALAVRASGPGPILFRQRRFGKDGEVFYIHKFRSMVADAEDRQLALRASANDADGPLFKLHRDPRITPVGRILRAWSLDELPQLFDVLRGHMSLVGPRPFVTDEVDLTDPWALTRLRVKPGVTGLWQVSGRHRLPFDELIRHDLFYVENWSLSMDLVVLLRTVPTVLARSGV
jgi:exopolysaccharide biosynthesis polyprenyl glycosylphosphotransferase